MFKDFQFAWRTLLKTPSFTVIAVLTLSLGIAGSVLIFTIFNALFLRPLPYKNSDRLVNLDEVAPRWNLEYTGLAYYDLCEWRAQNRTFDGMGAWDDARFNFSTKGNPQRVEGGLMTHDLLSVLGVQPILGRGFTREEDTPGKNQVAMVSYSFWKHQWARDSNVLGQTITLDAGAYTIIGVLPQKMGPLSKAEIVIPLARSQADDNGWYLDGIGRLKAGVTLEMARQDLTRIHKGLITARPVNEITSPRVTLLSERLLGDFRDATYMLMGAVGVVWLIACGNVAGLMLARGLGRSKEISVRMALGASRARVARQILVESLLLSFLAGAVGVCLGESMLKLFIKFLPEQVPTWINFGMDWRIVAFLLASTATTAGLFGLLPALQMASKLNLQRALQTSSTRSTGSSPQRRSLNILVIGEIALAMVLLIAAGLLLQAFRALQKTDPGFRAENVLTYDIALPEARYNEPRQGAFFEQHLAQVRALPGVKSASAVSIVPLGGHSGTFFKIENAPPKAKDEKDPVVLYRTAFPHYAEAMGLTLLSGRFISEQDTPINALTNRANNYTLPGAMPVVVINESFAKRAWPKQDPIGKRISAPAPDAPWITVIGVVKDIKHYGFDQPMRPGVYFPFGQSPRSQMSIVVRGIMDPKALVPSIRDLIKKNDPDLPIFAIKTMSERVRESLWVRMTYSSMLGFFAAVALTMALAGIYGVISYAVSQRTNEIGVRIALGAQKSDVLTLVLRHGLLLSALGIGLGLGGALALTRLMKTLLFTVSSIDPLTFIIVPLVLGAVTLLACLFPARRATRVDPVEALRCQ
jgi:putative ABC transport system permease protein